MLSLKRRQLKVGTLCLLPLNVSEIHDTAAQNAQLEAKINRRPSRIIVSKNKIEAAPTLAPPAPALAPSLSAMSASNLGTSLGPLSSSLNISSSHGNQILLRIRVASAEPDKALLFSSTFSVYVFCHFLDDV